MMNKTNDGNTEITFCPLFSSSQYDKIKRHEEPYQYIIVMPLMCAESQPTQPEKNSNMCHGFNNVKAWRTLLAYAPSEGF